MSTVILSALKTMGLAVFIAAIPLNYTVVYAQVFYDSREDIPDYDRETWQLIYADEAVWADSRTIYNNFPDEIKRSVIEQFKLVTWSIEDNIKYSTIWLDCNPPQMEIRRRVMRPAETTEHRGEDGNVSYTTIPAVLKPYVEIIRNNEGCSLIPPAENIDAAFIEGVFHTLFKQSRQVRYGDALTYLDAEGTSVVNFKLMSP